MILFCPRCGTAFPHKFRGEWFDSGPICSDCGVAVADPPPSLAPSDAEITYGHDEWPVTDRAALTGALVEDEIPYRWEPGIVLAVPDSVEAVVDGILDDLEVSDAEAVGESDDEPPVGGVIEGNGLDPDADPDADGGEEAQAAMSDLFVVADRLHHTPWDPELNQELATLVAVVAASLPPYGVDRSVWTRIHELATAVGEAADEEAATESTAALRDYLRPLV